MKANAPKTPSQIDVFFNFQDVFNQQDMVVRLSFDSHLEGVSVTRQHVIRSE